MTKIDDLIADLCPNGVEMRELNEIFGTRNGYTPSRADHSAWTDGTVPWFRMEDIRENGRVLSDSLQHINQSAVKGGRLFPANSILVATSATIGEHALITVPHLSNQRFTSLTLRAAFVERFEIKFVYYYCFVLDQWCKGNTTTSSFSSVDMAGFKKFKFPIPPLSIQREIVTILDELTRLQAELETELETELEYRSRQYAYYRDSLFTFAETEKVSWALMGEVGKFVRGRRFTKQDVVPEGVGSMHYGEIYTHYGTFASEAISHVRSELRPTLRFARAGDVVIAAVGETVEDVCKAVAWLGNEDVAIHDDCFAYRHTLNPKFVSYYLQTSSFHSEKNKHVARAKVKRISGESLAKMHIPVPPMEEQDRVVAILDRFSTLVNDLSVNLPDEIAARREQYEHYRGELLSFEEAT